jgi:hypothetical protein
LLLLLLPEWQQGTRQLAAGPRHGTAAQRREQPQPPGAPQPTDLGEEDEQEARHKALAQGRVADDACGRGGRAGRGGAVAPQRPGGEPKEECPAGGWGEQGLRVLGGSAGWHARGGGRLHAGAGAAVHGRSWLAARRSSAAQLKVILRRCCTSLPGMENSASCAIGRALCMSAAWLGPASSAVASSAPAATAPMFCEHVERALRALLPAEGNKHRSTDEQHEGRALV